MQSQLNQWNLSFVKHVSKYCRLLEKWSMSQIHTDFRQVLINNLLVYSNQPPVEWVNDNEFEVDFVKMTLTYYPDEEINAFEQLHAYDTFCKCLGEAVAVLWRYHLSEADTNSGRCLDNYISETLLKPPGHGVSYLCLMLAAELPMTATFEEEIAISRELCPILPFSENIKQTLLKIVKKESRLRLAMCMAQILGRSCDKLKLKVASECFDVQFVALLRELALIENYENVLCELNVCLEALICSRKHVGIATELPPSPINYNYD